MNLFHHGWTWMLIRMKLSRGYWEFMARSLLMVSGWWGISKSNQQPMIWDYPSCLCRVYQCIPCYQTTVTAIRQPLLVGFIDHHYCQPNTGTANSYEQTATPWVVRLGYLWRLKLRCQSWKWFRRVDTPTMSNNIGWQWWFIIMTV